MCSIAEVRGPASAGKREKAARERFYEKAGDFTRYLVVESDGDRFAVETADRSMKRFFAKRERQEAQLLALALERLAAVGADVRRSTFIDVGAHIGTVTFAALRAGFRSVVACEPLPQSARLLRANVALNDAWDAVRVLELALSDRSGTTVMEVGFAGGSSRSRVLARLPPRGEKTIEVCTASIDDLVAEGVLDADVGLLWLDVEGHEYHVLRGAKTLARRSVPLVVEWNTKLLARAQTADALAELLAEQYTHVLDLRSPGRDFSPVQELPELTRKRVTDLLLFRQSRP
jgi:FkbM family methyltransferase